MDKKELKALVWPTILTVILFGLLAFVVLPHTDMYKARQAEVKIAMRNYLLSNISVLPNDYLEETMARYELTFDDLSTLEGTTELTNAVNTANANAIKVTIAFIVIFTAWQGYKIFKEERAGHENN